MLFLSACTVSPLWVDPLKPIEPPATIRILPFHILPAFGFQSVSSLQPTLRWEPYTLFTPSNEEQGPQPIPISNVTYKIRIFQKTEGYSTTWRYGKNIGNPGLLIYHRNDLAQPFHKLEKPLEPDVESPAGIFPAACGVNYSREQVHSVRNSAKQHLSKIML